MTGLRHDPDRWIFRGIVATLVAAVGFIVWSSFELRARQLRLSEAALERSQQLLRVRLDALFHGFAEDLREEVSAMGEWDAPPAEKLVERWRPLITSHWAMTTIALADPSGSEIALLRDGEGLLLRTTTEGSKGGPPRVERLPMRPGGAVSPEPPPPPDPGRDPRAMVWFSKALEEARSEPVWNLRFGQGDTVPRLQVSLLVRGTGMAEAYRVMLVELDPSRLPWEGEHPAAPGGYGAMLMDGDGRRLNAARPGRAPVVAAAEQEASAHWARTKSRGGLSVEVSGRRFLGRVEPYLLNGQTLYTGTLIDVDLVAVWTDTERRGLMVVSGLVALLATLLGIAWLRRRRANARVSREAERSRSQERRLAQALGEREVLNREVHHRVKNNLQVVSSLLSLQAGRLADGPVRDEFLRGKRRIDTIALVHHKLYGLKDLRNVDLELFFGALIEALAAMHQPASRGVSCETDTSGLIADQDTAIELGIILCELVANCYQHAFPYATGGHVDIRVIPVEGDLHRLVVKDNGKGLADGYADGPGKLGLEIVEALADQLDGSFHVRANGGVTFEVLFRMRQGQTTPVGPAN